MATDAKTDPALVAPAATIAATAPRAMPPSASAVEGYAWDETLPGSAERVLGPASRWWTHDFSDGVRVVTLRVGIMSAHEARATPGIRGAGWVRMPFGPFVIAATISF